jgi:hypothetical protein
MKLAYILLNICLVGAGIFAYDALKFGDGNAPEPSGDEVVIERSEEPRDLREEAPPPIVLEGTGMEVLLARVAAQEQRIAELERALRERTSVVADAGTDASPGESGSWRPSGGWNDPDAGDPSNPSIDQGELQRFRAYMEAVEQARRDERMQTMVEGQLDRLGVVLSPEQRETVVRQTLDYREKLRDVMTMPRNIENEREERNAAIEEVRQEYSQAIYAAVPAQEAEKIIQGVGRFPGSGGQGFGGRNRPERNNR